MYCSFCNKDITGREQSTIFCSSKDYPDSILFRCCVECQADILLFALNKIIEKHYKILFRKFK